MKRLESHGKRGPATVNLQDKEAISHRNKALWSIVAQVHEKRGIEPVESDVELNARLSLEMARLFALPRLESEVIRRRAKYFAASTLFLMRDHDVASSETLPQFIARVLGPEFLEELTSEDLQVVDPEKVIFRQIEVECCRPSGLSRQASRSVLRSGRTEKCAKKL